MTSEDATTPRPDPSDVPPEPARTSPGLKLAVGAAGGAVAGTVGALTTGHVGLSVLAGWIVTAALFVGWTWLHLWPLDADDTATHATREDPTRRTTHLVLVVAALASVVGVAFVFFGTSTTDKAAAAGVAILGAVASWATIHTLYALAYARTYCAPGPDGDAAGGVDFHQDEPPRYSDFAYVAFTVGMSYAISDTDLGSSQMRRIAINHALLSYLFGTVILAALINLVAGL
ncbi:DUF1345 domain-containing protein [Luteimicrobium subarcticum]|uniref:Putative membrane protein n=1 Tax=Luteimicrobium subarcticum TaxID=620910 RepID=A0A2M8WS53_9MICO|nr:DUF1345 domain-containing protein [Luteimicrobium subarcticum]PJI93785.1 putative membrane protein [Luteimicrobium subarcticum]